MLRTKICTLGLQVKARNSPIITYMNIAELTITWDHKEHLRRIKALYEARAELKTDIALLLDTKGRK